VVTDGLLLHERRRTPLDMPDATFTNCLTTLASELSPESPLLMLRQQAWHRIRNSLRSGQQQMADWQGGPLAVSAVPGAGKSTGMAAAAALASPVTNCMHVEHWLLSLYALSRQYQS